MTDSKQQVDSTSDSGKTVPLLELLRSVPRDAVLSIDTPNALGCMDTRRIPVGRFCHEAADALEPSEAQKAGRAEGRALARFLSHPGWGQVIVP